MGQLGPDLAPGLREEHDSTSTAHATMNATTPSWTSAGVSAIKGMVSNSTPAAARRTTDTVCTVSHLKTT